MTIVEPDFSQPWSVYAEDDAVGSGFIVEKKGQRTHFVIGISFLARETEARGFSSHRSVHAHRGIASDAREARSWKNHASSLP